MGSLPILHETAGTPVRGAADFLSGTYVPGWFDMVFASWTRHLLNPSAVCTPHARLQFGQGEPDVNGVPLAFLPAEGLASRRIRVVGAGGWGRLRAVGAGGPPAPRLVNGEVRHGTQVLLCYLQHVGLEVILVQLDESGVAQHALLLDQRCQRRVVRFCVLQGLVAKTPEAVHSRNVVPRSFLRFAPAQSGAPYRFVYALLYAVMGQARDGRPGLLDEPIVRFRLAPGLPRPDGPVVLRRLVRLRRDERVIFGKSAGVHAQHGARGGLGGVFLQHALALAKLSALVVNRHDMPPLQLHPADSHARACHHEYDRAVYRPARVPEHPAYVVTRPVVRLIRHHLRKRGADPVPGQRHVVDYKQLLERSEIGVD